MNDTDQTTDGSPYDPEASPPDADEPPKRERYVLRKDEPEGSRRGGAPPARWLYFHGFGSSPRSSKAAFFRNKFNALGIPFDVPNLTVPDFEHLTVTEMLGAVDRIFRDEIGDRERVGIIGSSLGAIVALWTAARHTNVRRLLLLAPAFGLFRETFLGLGRAGVNVWEKRGYTHLYHHAAGGKQRISSDFLLDARGYDESKLRLGIPITIVHGQRDEVVDPALSAEYARRRDKVKLRLVDDDHSLLLSTTEIWDILWHDIRSRNLTRHTRYDDPK